MPAKDKIAILTGGGDVPGLNPVIKSVVYRASELGRSADDWSDHLSLSRD